MNFVRTAIRIEPIVHCTDNHIYSLYPLTFLTFPHVQRNLSNTCSKGICNFLKLMSHRVYSYIFRCCRNHIDSIFNLLSTSVQFLSYICVLEDTSSFLQNHDVKICSIFVLCKYYDCILINFNISLTFVLETKSYKSDRYCIDVITRCCTKFKR